MITRKYFARASIYNDTGTINKFTHSAFNRVSLFNQSELAYQAFVEEVKEFAEENDCEQWQIKAFNRI